MQEILHRQTLLAYQNGHIGWREACTRLGLWGYEELLEILATTEAMPIQRMNTQQRLAPFLNMLEQALTHDRHE